MREHIEPASRRRAFGVGGWVRAALGAAALLILSAAGAAAQGESEGAPAAAAATPKPGGEWVKRCDQSGKVCFVQTVLKDNNDRSAGALLLGRTPEHGVVGELRLPTGIYIPAGVLVRVDEALSFKAQLITCGGGFCIANFSAGDEVIAAMKKGAALVVRVRDVRSGQAVDLPFSLIGFTAQFDAL